MLSYCSVCVCEVGSDGRPLPERGQYKDTAMTNTSAKKGRLQVGSDVDDYEIDTVVEVRVVKKLNEQVSDILTLFVVTLFATIVGGCIVAYVMNVT